MVVSLVDKDGKTLKALAGKKNGLSDHWVSSRVLGTQAKVITTLKSCSTNSLLNICAIDSSSWLM